MRSMHRTPTLLATALLLFLAACGSQATLPDEEQLVEAPVQEEALPEAEPEVEPLDISGPWMTVSGQGVSLAEGEDLPPQQLVDGDLVDLYDGLYLSVEADSQAALGWPAIEGDASSVFATGELLGGAELVVEASDPEIRSVWLEQRAGTGRYTLIDAGDDAAADLTVRAGKVNARAGAGQSSNFILSYDHSVAAPVADADQGERVEASTGAQVETGAHVWVIVHEGQVQVSTVETVASSAGQSAAQSVKLMAGQAAAFTPAGKLAVAVALKPTAIDSWYTGVAAGLQDQPIAEIPAVEPQPQTVELAAGEELIAVASPPDVTFTADRTEIQLGQCTMLRWKVTEVLFVSMEGRDVPDAGSQEVCPEKSYTYTLAHTGMDGKDRTDYVGVKVINPNAAPGQADEDPPAPPPTATPCVGEECEIVEPPPVAGAPDPGEPGPPSLDPLPTLPPALPTSAPVPDPTQPPPDPTDPPAPEPTAPPPPPDPTQPPGDPTDPPPGDPTPAPDPTDPPPGDPTPAPDPTDPPGDPTDPPPGDPTPGTDPTDPPEDPTVAPSPTPTP